MLKLLARGEYLTLDPYELIWQVAYYLAAATFVCANSLDLLVLWSYFQLDRKLSL